MWAAPRGGEEWLTPRAVTRPKSPPGTGQIISELTDRDGEEEVAQSLEPKGCESSRPAEAQPVGCTDSSCRLEAQDRWGQLVPKSGSLFIQDWEPPPA